MSAKTLMKIQIAMNQKKNTSIAHRTSPKDHSVANIASLHRLGRLNAPNAMRARHDGHPSIRMKETSPTVHVAAMRNRARWGRIDAWRGSAGDRITVRGHPS